MRGAYYQDFATIRVRDFAKVKAAKLVMTRTLVECALVRPGTIDTGSCDASFKTLNEFKLLGVVASKKIKGELTLNRLLVSKSRDKLTVAVKWFF